MITKSLMAGAAAVALMATPSLASAQDQAALEARIAQLEAQLNALKSEVVAARTQQAAQQQDIIRLETRPAAPAPGCQTRRPPASPVSARPTESAARTSTGEITSGSEGDGVMVQTCISSVAGACEIGR